MIDGFRKEEMVVKKNQGEEKKATVRPPAIIITNTAIYGQVSLEIRRTSIVKKSEIPLGSSPLRLSAKKVTDIVPLR